MQNFIQKGDTLTLKAPYDVKSGDAVLVGKIFGVAIKNVPKDADGEFVTEGVFDLPVKAADVAAQGDPMYWDAVAKGLTTTSQGNTRVGVAAIAKPAGGATVRLKLDETVA